MTRILVVDDEPDIARSIKVGLEKRAFQVDAFIDPEEALEKFRPAQYDLLILDYRMPKLDGFALAKEIRKRDPKVPVIFLTAYDVLSAEFEENFPQTSGDLLKKPMSISELVSEIRARLGQGSKVPA